MESNVFTDNLEDVGEITPNLLLNRYSETLTDLIDSVGKESVHDRTAIDLQKLEGPELAALTLEEASKILSLRDDKDHEAIRAEIEDHLLLGMTTAVLDVESVAASIELNLDPKEVHQKVEGRSPMTVEEYAHVNCLILQRQWK